MTKNRVLYTLNSKRALVKFQTFNIAKIKWRNPTQVVLYDKQGKVAILSALANWAGDLLLYPLDVISTRLKANKYQNHNPFHYIRSSIQN